MIRSNIALGVIFGICSGVLSGSYGMGMKKIKGWNWENTLLTYSFWALLVFPFVLAWTTVPDFWNIIGSVPFGIIGLIFILGAGWGLANIGFGIGLREIGIALTSVIVIGIGNVLGTISPLVIYHRESLWKPVGICIICGAIISLLGIILSSLESWPFSKKLPQSPPQKTSHYKVIIICICAGILGIFFNFALIVGNPLAKLAVLHGAKPQNASNVTWFITLLGGFTVSAIYCSFLLIKNHTLQFFHAEESVINCSYTALMGLVWFGGTALYGISVLYFGKFGPSIGWPIFQSVQIMAANLLGIVTGEWNHLDRKTFTMRLAGIVLLISGIIITSAAGKLA
ncbi:MAG TPA: L-rhamnose/proton symporter RhaT [Bacillota bacterium]|nr:L-rhamnose/proton symporter RhaT [Bacillota bacterium]